MFASEGAGAAVGQRLSAEASSSHTGSRPSQRPVGRAEGFPFPVSRTNMERGRLLELTLYVLSCAAQWVLHCLADRYCTYLTLSQLPLAHARDATTATVDAFDNASSAMLN